MEFNGKNIDIDKSMQELALTYANFELEKANRAGSLGSAPQDALNLLYSEYFMALGYLTNVSDEYIRKLLGHCE